MPKACTFRKINKFRELSWYGLDVRVVTHVVRTPHLVVDALANGVEAGGWGIRTAVALGSGS